MSDSRPNILWISLEDTSPLFGCYGSEEARTPNIDKLASEGTIFKNAFSTAGVCAPSRASIITGMYQTSIGAHHMRTTHANRMTPEMPTPYECCPPHYLKLIPEYLRSAGYYCTNNTKTDYQFQNPFTAWDDPNKTGHWRNRPEKSQPFFSVFNPTVSHESGQWPKDGESIETKLEDVIVPPYLPDTENTRKAIARQHDNNAKNDAFVADRLKELEEDGLADNTLVILWSDHGSGMPRAKRWLYDTGIHIPCIVRWPGMVEEDVVSEQMVSLIDLGPTILSAAGIDLPYHLQGQAFVGDAAQPRDYIYAARDRFDESYDMVRAVRDKRFKYIRNYYPHAARSLWIPYRNRHPSFTDIWAMHARGELNETQQLMVSNDRPVEELYDTLNDPWEVNNLAQDPAFAPELDRLREALDVWRGETGDMGEIPEADMVNAWWPGGEQPTTAAPVLVPLGVEDNGTQGWDDNAAETKGPVLLQMHCCSQGASIGYTFDEGDDANWQLYSGPFPLPGGKSTLRAKAIRIGYKESKERTIELAIN